jgi:hypothetical protein
MALKFLQSPSQLLGSSVMVLKSPGPNEKGVVLANYSYVFPLFAKLFDLERIFEKYYIVLEPSWSGYCDLDLLCYSYATSPVFVESIEPRDTDFVRAINANFVPVPTAANWWIDHRIFRPLPEVGKDVDVIMVAGWGRYKRHHRLFAALRQLRSRGMKLKTSLVGYPLEMTKEDIAREAMQTGVFDQIELHEWLSPAEVNHQLNRAKVNLLWSRREGVNRAIVEGMLAGVPCIVREGFNYGCHYPHINPQTGCYSTERQLPETLAQMCENYRDFRSRQWVIDNMSCQRGTELMGAAIKNVALSAGGNWTKELVVKINALHGISYWNPDDARFFAEDYDFLKTMIRNHASSSAQISDRMTVGSNL